MIKKPKDRSKTRVAATQSVAGSGVRDAAVLPPVPSTHVVVGVIGAAHGLRGEVRLKSFTQDPMAIGNYGALRMQDGRSVQVIPQRHLRDDLIIAKLSGMSDRTAVETLTGLQLSMPRDHLPSLVEDDEFYHADLISLPVEDEQGQRLGHIVGLFNHGAGDMLEIKLNRPGPTDFLPFTKDYVPRVEVKAGRVVVRLPADFGVPVAPPSRQAAERKAGARKAGATDGKPEQDSSD